MHQHKACCTVCRLGRKRDGVNLQVRSAYRRRGWGFTDPQQISQCAKEGFVEKLKAQEGEGCHMWGTLAVNKVRVPPTGSSSQSRA